MPQIFVKTLSGKTVTIDVEEDATVGDAKQAYSTKEGFPLEHLRLIFAGKSLNDDSATLASLKIAPESTLHQVMGSSSGSVVRITSNNAPLPPMVDTTKYHEGVKSVLASVLNSAAQTAKTFLFIGLGCYDNNHGVQSIYQQQCPQGLFSFCEKSGFTLHIILVDDLFGGHTGNPPQVFDLDPEWDLMRTGAGKLVKIYRHLSTGSVLGTFATRIFVAEYAGTQLTLAGVNLVHLSEALKKGGGGCLIGNFYSSLTPPHIATHLIPEEEYPRAVVAVQAKPKKKKGKKKKARLIQFDASGKQI